MNYEDLYPLPRRPFQKQIGKRWSEYALGRRRNLAQLLKYGSVTVKAYRTKHGKVFFTDPVRSTTRTHQPNTVGYFTIRLKGFETK